MGARWVTLGVGAALVLLGLFGPPTVPLYDGVGFPDEAYRFVRAPVGVTRTTKPPTAISTTVPVVGGTTDGFNAASAEQGPQVSVFVPVRTLLAPDPARTITVRVQPRAPDGPADGGRVDGNVYRFTAIADGGAPSVARTGDTIQVILRATSARQPGPVAEYRPIGGATWTLLRTSRFGTDVYAAAAKGFGDYALVFDAASTSRSAPASRPGSGTGGRLGLVLGGLIVALAAILLTIRIKRSRRTA